MSVALLTEVDCSALAHQNPFLSALKIGTGTTLPECLDTPVPPVRESTPVTLLGCSLCHLIPSQP